MAPFLPDGVAGAGALRRSAATRSAAASAVSASIARRVERWGIEDLVDGWEVGVATDAGHLARAAGGAASGRLGYRGSATLRRLRGGWRRASAVHRPTVSSQTPSVAAAPSAASTQWKRPQACRT